jgi:hypothetical protein
LGEKSGWLEILLMVLWHVDCLSCIWPKATALNLTASDTDKAPVGREVRKTPNIRSTIICCRLFQIGFSSYDAIECSGSLLRDLRLRSLTITTDAQIMGLWGSWTGFTANATRDSQYKTVCKLWQRKIIGAFGKLRKGIML